MGLLDARTALVTGAGRGLGRAVSVALAREGAAIIAADLDAPTETARAITDTGGSVLAVAADVRRQSDLDAAVAAGLARFGSIEVCVANAGVFSLGPIEQLTEEQWSAVVDVNLAGMWRTAKSVLPQMYRQRGGSIVLVSSVNAFEASVGTGHYTSTKHAVIGLGRSVAAEAAVHGVRCNVVCPGSMDTGMLRAPEMAQFLGQGPAGVTEGLRRAGARYSALAPADVMTPEEVCGPVVFLASAMSASVTGVALPVDRGHLLLPKINEDVRTYAPDLR